MLEDEPLVAYASMSMKRDEGPDDKHTARDRCARMSDAELVAAVQEGDSPALDEFIVRFSRLLFDRARRLGIPRIQCEDAVVWVIETVAQRLALGEILIRSSVAAYLVRCFQREYARTEKKEQVRADMLRERMHDPARTGEHMVIGLCSEYAVGASRGPGWEPPPASLAVERLATMIEDELTADEERLLVWMSNEVDLSAIAREFGLKYDTLAKRVRRLRERMRTAALRHAEQFELEERKVLVRFFTRANRLYEAAVLSASIDPALVALATPVNARGSGEEK